MIAKLKPSYQVFDLIVGDHTIPGMREDGAFGPIKRFKSEKGEALYVFDQKSHFTRAFSEALGSDDGDGYSIVGGHPDLIFVIENAVKGQKP